MAKESKKQEKQPTTDDIRLDNQAQITKQLVHQLERYLPIHSVEKIMGEMSEVEVGRYQVPLKVLAPFISNDLLPIETTEDLERKLSAGVRRTVALAQTGFIQVGNPLFIEILSTYFQEPKGSLNPKVPVRNIHSPAFTSASNADTSMDDKGGK